MTLSLAWVRHVGDTDELVFASDSRLRGGYAWDCCPKIFRLPRSDSALSFAHDTALAYPMIAQIIAAVSQFHKLRERAIDLLDFKGHSLRLMNSLLEHMHDLPIGQAEPDKPDVFFILGGFSWRTQGFHIWTLHYDTAIKRFTYRPASEWRNAGRQKHLAIAGDCTNAFKEQLLRLLKNRSRLTEGGFDMEPFEVLRDMIRSEEFPTIGGPPQVAKVYRHMNTRVYPIFWPNRVSGEISILGRPLLAYEKTYAPVLDPDTLDIVNES